MLPLKSAGGVSDQVTVHVFPASIIGIVVGEVAVTVQPAGLCRVTLTSRIWLFPTLSTVAVAVVGTPACRLGWVCAPATVLAMSTFTVGRFAWPSRTRTVG